MAEKVIGYLCNRGGKYKYKYLFEGTGEKIASFIIHNINNAEEIIVTDTCDLFIVSFDGNELCMADDLDEKMVLDFMKTMTQGCEPLKFKKVENYMEEI